MICTCIKKSKVSQGGEARDTFPAKGGLNSTTNLYDSFPTSHDYQDFSSYIRAASRLAGDDNIRSTLCVSTTFPAARRVHLDVRVVVMASSSIETLPIKWRSKVIK